MTGPALVRPVGDHLPTDRSKHLIAGARGQGDGVECVGAEVHGRIAQAGGHASTEDHVGVHVQVVRATDAAGTLVADGGDPRR